MEVYVVSYCTNSNRIGFAQSWRVYECDVEAECDNEGVRELEQELNGYESPRARKRGDKRRQRLKISMKSQNTVKTTKCLELVLRYIKRAGLVNSWILAYFI